MAPWIEQFLFSALEFMSEDVAARRCFSRFMSERAALPAVANEVEDW